MTPKTYKTPESFKLALEQKIRDRAKKNGTTIDRERSLVVFDRLLARTGQEFGDFATLKGGLALELRLFRARTTRDVDLRMMGSPVDVLARLQAAARLDLGDFMRFEIVPDPEHPDIMGDAAKYDGHRFRAVCQIAGKRYADPFGIDVAFGDPIFGEPEVMTAPDVLDFIGVPPPTLRVYPIETHLAEKLHAYTMPRRDGRMNSRVKDLPDLALLATTRPLRSEAIRGALAQTFAHRATHEVPRALPDPPPEWTSSYAQIAKQNKLTWLSLLEVTQAARRFLDPVLGDNAPRMWSPQDWAWSSYPDR